MNGLRLVAAVAVLLAAACGTPVPAGPAGSDTVQVRFGVVASGGGAEVPQTMIATGIAAKYGIDVTIVPYATPGQQYTLVRGGAADVVPGNVLDLERQRHAGLGLHAFLGFQRFSSPIVVSSGSAVRDFAGLRHARVGQFGPTTLDWLAVRAAGVRGHGVDLAAADVTQASPALLLTLLDQGRIDAALQFASLAVGPVAAGRERVLTTVPDLLRAAGLSPDALDVVWDVADTWTAAHPGQIDRLRAAIQETYARLRTADPTLWAPLTKLVGITTPATAQAYVAEEIANMDPPFRADLLAPTQQLVDAITQVAGPGPLGVTRLSATDFLFAPG